MTKDWFSDILLNGVETLCPTRPQKNKEPLTEVEELLQKIRDMRQRESKESGNTGGSDHE